MTRQQLLSNASIKVVNPERREDTFPTIAKLWSAYLSKPISESDVCALMILLKAARLSAGYSSADSLVDIAGYAACAAEYLTDDHFIDDFLDGWREKVRKEYEEKIEKSKENS